MTSIEWTDRVWNPTVGCSRVSAGCDHCYAMIVAHRGLSPDHRGLTKLRPRDHARPGVDWTGEVRTLPERLSVPLRWRKPSRVFVDSMSDLFHPSVPFDFIAAVFGVMAATPHHTYQVLTKRPERAREFFVWLEWRVHDTSMPGSLMRTTEWARREGICYALDEHAKVHVKELRDGAIRWAGGAWPLPNVWLGTSVEDQATADARVPELLQCPAALRFVSYEPALGPVDFRRVMAHGTLAPRRGHESLRWIIVGGESGNGARSFDIAWARNVIEQARGTGCRVFVKQLGADPRQHVAPTGAPDDGGDMIALDLVDPKGGNPDEWPEDLRVREMPT